MNENVTAVYNIFKNYYGEDRVDIKEVEFSNNEIIVYWPKITITNEFDESTTITKFFGKVKINNLGRIVESFKFLKTEYSLEHWKADYIHSHIPRLNKPNIGQWGNPCLGSGPINNTLHRLRNEYSEHDWMLLCFELDKYVQVESVSGVPYYRISSINAFGLVENITYTTAHMKLSTLGKDFYKYLLSSNILKFTFYNNNYLIGMSDLELVLKVSDLFIKWFNKNYKHYPYKTYQDLLSANILKQAYYINDKLYRPSDDDNNIVNTENYNEVLLTFKNVPIKLTFSDIDRENKTSIINILNLNTIGNYVYNTLKFLNCNYGKGIENIQERRIL